jgi:hypothetical protein
LVFTCARCSIALYDVRANTPLRKLVMLKRANKARARASADGRRLHFLRVLFR